MIKLGWGLVAHKDALWAQVLRFKYGCGNLTIPNMKCGARVSHLWRGIFQQWQYVEQGILWIVKNGNDVRFWQDCWVPEMGSLSDHALLATSEHDYHLSIKDFSAAGSWN